jgi:hypothetical protein
MFASYIGFRSLVTWRIVGIGTTVGRFNDCMNMNILNRGSMKFNPLHVTLLTSRDTDAGRMQATRLICICLPRGLGASNTNAPTHWIWVIITSQSLDLPKQSQTAWVWWSLDGQGEAGAISEIHTPFQLRPVVLPVLEISVVERSFCTSRA